MDSTKLEMIDAFYHLLQQRAADGKFGEPPPDPAGLPQLPLQFGARRPDRRFQMQ